MDRNFFGSQIDSFETNLPCKIPGDENGPFRALFIRAPAILSVGDGVEVLGEYFLPEEKRSEIDDKSLEKIIVAVKQKQLMATSFHPEITADTRWHKLFVGMAGQCEAYGGFGEDALAKAMASEIKLVDPGKLPIFNDSVFAGPAMD